MKIRDRIRELRRVPASQLQPHPRNWRTHPQAQQDALRGMLAEIGYAGALVARELPDGGMQLLDGHLRAETTPDMEVPVLVVDLDDDEALKLLALLDPLAAMAGTDGTMLAGLAEELQIESDALRKTLDELVAADPPALEVVPPEVDLDESFQVVVECGDEADQRAVYERMTGEGYSCRLLTL